MASFSVFPGPIANLDPAGELDWTGLLAAVREGRHPLLGDWRDPLPMDREARKAEQRRRGYTTPNCTLRRRENGGFLAFSDCLFADLDDARDAPAIRDAVALEPSCLCAWLSASRNGVHSLHRCEQRRTPEDHRNACANLRRRLLALELPCEFDLCANAYAQPLFVAHDPDARNGRGSELVSTIAPCTEAVVDSLPKAQGIPQENRRSLRNTLPGSRWRTLRSVLFGMLNAKRRWHLTRDEVRKLALTLNATMPVPLPVDEVIRLADGVRDSHRRKLPQTEQEYRKWKAECGKLGGKPRIRNPVREARDDRIWERHLANVPERKIAMLENVSKTTVHKVIANRRDAEQRRGHQSYPSIVVI